MADVSRCFLGIDIGNTRSRVVLVHDSRIVARSLLQRSANDGFHQVADAVTDRARSMVKRRGLSGDDLGGAGVGFGGPVDADKGVALRSHNAPGWRRAPLKSAFEDRLGVPVLLENDANAAAWGEYVCSYSSRYRHVFYMTISTGVGGGIIADGRLYRGQKGLSGEIGHVIVHPDGPECACGNRGCLESLVSGASIARRVERETRMDTQLAARLRRFADGDGRVTSKGLHQAALENEPFALAVWQDVGRDLASGLRTAVRLLDPEAIVLGGGVVKARRFFMPEMKRVLEEDEMISRFSRPRIHFSRLGDFSVAYGAAMLCADAALRD